MRLTLAAALPKLIVETFVDCVVAGNSGVVTRVVPSADRFSF